MKTALKISFLILLIVLVGACTPKGKGKKKKKKCNECPTWGYQIETQDKVIFEEKV